MRCSKCKKEKKAKDFMETDWIKNKSECTKCIYESKLKIIKKDKGCRLCNDKIPEGRWVYCSKACSEIGALQKKKEHWTLNLNYDRKSWRDVEWKYGKQAEFPTESL